MMVSTQECYTRSVCKIVNFYDKTPDLITEADLENYFLHRQNEDKWAPLGLGLSLGLCIGPYLTPINTKRPHSKHGVFAKDLTFLQKLRLWIMGKDLLNTLTAFIQNR